MHARMRALGDECLAPSPSAVLPLGCTAAEEATTDGRHLGVLTEHAW
jgi:hypothetical protein